MTFCVLNEDKSSDVNEEQPQNIEYKLIVFWVLNEDTLTDDKEEQLLNIPPILVTFFVLNEDTLTDDNEEHPLNILFIEVNQYQQHFRIYKTYMSNWIIYS